MCSAVIDSETEEWAEGCWSERRSCWVQVSSSGAEAADLEESCEDVRETQRLVSGSSAGLPGAKGAGFKLLLHHGSVYDIVHFFPLGLMCGARHELHLPS